MTVSLQDRIEAAEQYERLFVPAEFREWAPRLLDAARVSAGTRLLDVACGTGVVAREALVRVEPGGRVTGLDINEGMLAVASRIAPAVDWRQGSVAALPFPDGAFDAVTCQFGLMFFPDRPRALREMRRVLAPGGRLAVAVWDTLEHTPAYQRLAAILRPVEPGAAEALGTPFSLGDRGALASVFAAAGLEPIAIRTVTGTGRFPSIRAMIDAELTGWMPIAGIVLTDAQKQRILEEAEHELKKFADDTGAVVFDSPAHIVTLERPETWV